MGVNPAFGSRKLTILLGMAILGNDIFRCECQNLRTVRSHDHRDNDPMAVGRGAVRMRLLGTLRAIDHLR